MSLSAQLGPEWGGNGYARRREYTLAGNVEAIAPVVESVRALLEETQSAPGSELEVILVLQEALANAVVHGCKNDPNGRVLCLVACDPERGVLIVVRDPGPGFDPAAVPNTLDPEGLASDHGRGVFLMHRLMDQVAYARNGAELRMRRLVRRQGAPAS